MLVMPQAPCDCFNLVNSSQICFLRDAYSITCVPLSSGEYAAPYDIRLLAWAVVGIYGIGIPLFYASLLFLSRRELAGESEPTELSLALRFLCRGYRRDAFAWELVEVTRKLLLTGFLALVHPGSLLQLYLGVSVSLCTALLQLYAAPYVKTGDNFLAAVSASAITTTFLASLGIQLTELWPELTALGQGQVGANQHDLSLIVCVLVVSSLLVFSAALAFCFADARAASRQRLLCSLDTKQPIELLSRHAPHSFHVFLSRIVTSAPTQYQPPGLTNWCAFSSR